MPIYLTTPINEIKTVGTARAKIFNRMGIITAGDLLRHYPRAYQNRAQTVTLAEAGISCEGTDAPSPKSLILTVASEPVAKAIPRRLSILSFRAFDETGACRITFFNQNYLKDTFHTGERFRFWGRVTRERGSLQMTCPVYEKYDDTLPLKPIVPVYPLKDGISQKYISQLIETVLSAVKGQLCDHFALTPLLSEHKLCTLGEAIANIHFPESLEMLDRARARLIFDEMFIMSASLASAKTRTKKTGAPIMNTPDMSEFYAALPFSLTGAQRRCINEMASDMSKDEPMGRILIGDVGSGKTVVAAAGAFIAARNGYQTAIMVPTEILAYQHFRDLETLFAKLGIRAELLCGSTGAAKKRDITETLAGQHIPGMGIDVIIGTHALLQDNVSFERPGLVITDEQHRFGVNQRAALSEKAGVSHSLVMSATPIPRTLSLVYYGDLSVSRLDETPPGRKKVDTFVVNEDYRERLNAFIRKQAQEGHQTYVVCPAIEESTDRESEKASENAEELADIISFSGGEFEKKPPLKTAVEYAKALALHLPELSVGFIHGRLRSAEKEKIMLSFADGRTDVLVSTTVIEVGMNVPNATLMVVENAERFGLSQLHQLRGRVGRSDAKSYCILMSDTDSPVARQRLNVMKQTADGYIIAEEDLKLRGPGDFFSSSGEIRQHGAAHLALASDCTDEKLIFAAINSARQMVTDDPDFAKEENRAVGLLVAKVRDNAQNTIN